MQSANDGTTYLVAACGANCCEQRELRTCLARSAAQQQARGQTRSYDGAWCARPVALNDVSYGFDIWAKGQWSQAHSDAMTSGLGLLYIGADYQFSDALVFGLLAQFDWSYRRDQVGSMATDGKGWLVGPYLAVRLHQNLLIDGRVAWGRSDNNVRPFGTCTDGCDTTRWLVSARLTGDFNYEAWHFAPHLGVLYVEERQHAYTDSLNVSIPSQTVLLGRLTFGPTISYRYVGRDGTVITPSLSLKGLWDFDKAHVVDLDSGTAAASSDDLRGRAEAGRTARFANGWTLNGSGFYDGIGASNLEAYGGSIELSIPLQE